MTNRRLSIQLAVAFVLFDLLYLLSLAAIAFFTEFPVRGPFEFWAILHSPTVQVAEHFLGPPPGMHSSWPFGLLGVSLIACLVQSALLGWCFGYLLQTTARRKSGNAF